MGQPGQPGLPFPPERHWAMVGTAKPTTARPERSIVARYENTADESRGPVNSTTLAHRAERVIELLPGFERDLEDCKARLRGLNQIIRRIVGEARAVEKRSAKRSGRARWRIRRIWRARRAAQARQGWGFVLLPRPKDELARVRACCRTIRLAEDQAILARRAAREKLPEWRARRKDAQEDVEVCAGVIERLPGIYKDMMAQARYLAFREKDEGGR